MGDSKTASKILERRLSIATWVLSAVHIVWYWYYISTDEVTGLMEKSFLSFSDWWGFCLTPPGAATALLSLGFSIWQCVVMLRGEPLDDSKIRRRKPAAPSDAPGDDED